MRRAWGGLLTVIILTILVAPLPAAAAVAETLPQDRAALDGVGFHLEGGELTTTALDAWGGVDVALSDLRFDAGAGLEVYVFGLDMSQIDGHSRQKLHLTGTDLSDVAPYLAISNWGVAQVEAHTVSWDEAVVIGRPVHVWVDDDYADSGANDGHFWGLDAFNTIEAGVAAVADGGTVHVAAGEYDPAQVVIDRPVTLLGAGPDETCVDGGTASLTSTGTLRIKDTTGPVTITGLTIQNAGDSGGDVAAICGRGFAAPVTLEDCHFIGHGGSALTDMGVYMYSTRPGGRVTIEGCEFEAMWQGILLELPRGGASVVDNTFHDLVPLLSDGTLYEPEGMFAFTYGEGNDVSELMAANGNSFYDFNGLAIAFGGGYPNQDYMARFTDVEIRDNTINAIGAGPERFHAGIAFSNYGRDAAQAATGGVHNVTIAGNTLGGGGPDSIGIWIRGPNNDFTVENNVIGGVNRGIAVDERTAGAGCATGLVVLENAFSGNTTAIANAGPAVIANAGSAVIAAAGNWWGDATGPCHAATNPGGAGDDVTDNVAYSPWLGSGENAAGGPGFEPKRPLNWYLNTTGTVQGAVDAASPGDTVNIIGGPYPEGVVVDKALTLRGVYGGAVIGAGLVPAFDGYQVGLYVTAPGVTIEDLALDGAVKEEGALAAQYGVLLDAARAELSDLDVENYAFGVGTVDGSDVDECVIDGCTFSGITSSGIYFNPGADGNTVTDCDVAAAWEGIVIDSGL